MRTPTTTERYCPRCRAEVEASDGFCLLGHKLTLAPATNVSDLRAEVDRIFENARTEFAAALESAVVQVEAHRSAAGDDMRPLTTYVRDSSVRSAPPPPPPARPNPPPPPPARPTVWDALEVRSTAGDDPISAFAPAPRMDWGPEREARRPRWFRRASGASA